MNQKKQVERIKGNAQDNDASKEAGRDDLEDFVQSLFPLQRRSKLPHDLGSIPVLPLLDDDDFVRAMSKLSGGVTLPEAAYLSMLASKIRRGCILEVGSFKGKSTVALSQGARQSPTEPTVFCIEPHRPFVGIYGGKFGPKDRGEYYRAMLASEAYLNTSLINLSSEEVCASWQREIALCFIDGDHSYEGAKRDWDCWKDHMANGGIVVFDDATVPESGPGRVISEFLGSASDWKKIDAPDKFVALQHVSPKNEEPAVFLAEKKA